MENIKETKIKKSHTVSIASKISITGVENVINMGEKEVQIALSNNILFLYGNDFSVTHLSIDDGVLTLTGELVSLKYARQASKESFIKRLLK